MPEQQEVATAQEVVDQAKAAADEFNAPIRIGAAVKQPSKELTKSLLDMGRKQVEIHRAAAKEILESEALNEALKSLKSATDNLNQTASHMTDVTAIVTKADTLIGYGTDAVNAITSVVKPG